MFKRILVPTDGSEITAKAVTTAVSMAKVLGAKVYAISVKEPFPYSAISEMQPTPPQEFFDAQERIAAKRVQAVVEACKAAGIACEAHTVEALHAWEAIIDHAQRQECDSGGDGLARPPRRVGPAPGQRNAEGAHALEGGGADRSVTGCRRSPRRSNGGSRQW